MAPAARTDADAETRFLWGAVALTLAGTLLRVLTLNARSFWLDEATSVRQASWSIPVIIQRMSGNVHPPLFHIALHYWIRYFGRGEIAVRTFPLLFGIASIPLAYWATREIYDRRVAIFSAGIVAFAPFFIWYSQEARMYTMMLVFAIVSLGALWKALQQEKADWWIVYAISTAAGLMTHFLFGTLVLGQAAYVLGFLVLARQRDLARSRERARGWRRITQLVDESPEAKRWAIWTAIALVPYLWWMPLVIFHGTTQGTISLKYAAVDTEPGQQFNQLMLAASQAIFGMHGDATTRDLSAMWPLGITAGFLSLAHWRRVSQRTWYVLLSGLLGASAIAVLSQWQPTYEVRYFTAEAIAAVIVIARLLAELDERVVRVVLAAALVVALVGYVDQSYNPDNVVKWDNREATTLLAQRYQPGDTIVLVPYYASSILEYYLPPNIFYSVREVPLFDGAGQARDSSLTIGQDLDRGVGPSQRVWVVSSFTDTPRVAANLKTVHGWLARSAFSQVQDHPFHLIDVALYTRPTPRPFFIGQTSAP